jgi:hypothetical protein
LYWEQEQGGDCYGTNKRKLARHCANPITQTLASKWCHLCDATAADIEN